VVLATAYDALAEKVAELTKRAESAEALYWAVAKMLSNAGDYSDAPDDDDAVVIAADYNAVVAAHLAHKPSNSAKGEHSKIVMYKPGVLDANGLRDLKKAGYTCVLVNGQFADVQFRMVGGIGFEDDMGDMQVMIVKAALQSFNFSDKLGEIITANLKRKLAAKPPSGSEK
jgi:hypothetical protein